MLKKMALVIIVLAMFLACSGSGTFDIPSIDIPPVDIPPVDIPPIKIEVGK